MVLGPAPVSRKGSSSRVSRLYIHAAAIGMCVVGLRVLTPSTFVPAPGGGRAVQQDSGAGAIPPPLAANSLEAKPLSLTAWASAPPLGTPALGAKGPTTATSPVSELLPAFGAILGGLAVADGAAALMDPGQVELTPDTFRPVCPASDGLYNFGKGVGDALLGSEGAEYRPLVIEALLRVRLEVCVLESFVYEAIIPFVQRKGLGWILPLHESIDTVIAGTVFAVALNFILFGTTKILAVLSIYHDFLIGAPLRLVGFAIYPEKRAKSAPFIQINWPGTTPETETSTQTEDEDFEKREPPSPPLAVFGAVCKGYGIFAEVLKNLLEGLDTFVGRYLAFVSVAYVGFKWAHFRLFNDFPPF